MTNPGNHAYKSLELLSETFEAFTSVLDDCVMYKVSVFKENFRGVWGSQYGVLCYIEIAYEGESYNQYSVPIQLNGDNTGLIKVTIFHYQGV